jgi:hypothetical protein
VTLVREDARWAFVRPGPQLSGFVHSDELKRTGLLNRQVTGRTQVGGGSLGCCLQLSYTVRIESTHPVVTEAF